MTTLPSLHDSYLIAYEVNCEHREIRLHTRRADWAEERAQRTVTFTEVQGYHFRNDAFGNIVFALEEIPVERFFLEYGSEIVESYRAAGAPGPWAADLKIARQLFTVEGIKAFVLSSSYGLSGWILAKKQRCRRASGAISSQDEP